MRRLPVSVVVSAVSEFLGELSVLRSSGVWNVELETAARRESRLKAVPSRGKIEPGRDADLLKGRGSPIVLVVALGLSPCSVPDGALLR